MGEKDFVIIVINTGWGGVTLFQFFYGAVEAILVDFQGTLWYLSKNISDLSKL